MASLTWLTWVWASSGSWWWTRKSGVLQSMGSQSVRHDWATELNWTQHLQTDPCFEMRIVRYSRRTWQTSVTEAELCNRGQGLANCSPHTQSSPLLFLSVEFYWYIAMIIIFVLFTAVFAIKGQIWVFATETLWPEMSKIFTIWSFSEKVCWPLAQDTFHYT